MSKGSHRRPENRAAVEAGWLRAFGNAVADEYFLGDRTHLDSLCDSRITKTPQASFIDPSGVVLTRDA